MWSLGELDMQNGDQLTISFILCSRVEGFESRAELQIRLKYIFEEEISISMSIDTHFSG